MQKITALSQSLIAKFEHFGLIFIALATIVAASSDVYSMAQAWRVTLGDLLMLFLYMEVLSMVRHYLSTGAMPVRYPLYIGIVALTRYLVLDMKELDSVQVLSLAAATLLLSLAVLAIRVGHVRYPYPTGDDGSPGQKHDSYK